MCRVARWCVTHRLAVIAAWIVVLVGAVFVQSSTGSNYANGTKLSGTQAAIAQNLLQQASPGAAGDSERIVFATHGGSVTAPAVRAQICAIADVPGRVELRCETADFAISGGGFGGLKRPRRGRKIGRLGAAGDVHRAIQSQRHFALVSRVTAVGQTSTQVGAEDQSGPAAL